MKTIPNQIPPTYKAILKEWYAEASELELLKLWGCVDECTFTEIQAERARHHEEKRFLLQQFLQQNPDLNFKDISDLSQQWFEWVDSKSAGQTALSNLERCIAEFKYLRRDEIAAVSATIEIKEHDFILEVVVTTDPGMAGGRKVAEFIPMLMKAIDESKIGHISMGLLVGDYSKSIMLYGFND